MVLKKTKQAIKKNIDPNIDQKDPILAMTKPRAEITNSIQPIKFIWLSVIVIFLFCRLVQMFYLFFFWNQPSIFFEMLFR